MTRSEPLAVIVSAGSTKYGKHPHKTARELVQEAFIEAVENARNLDPKKDIDAVIISQMSSEYELQAHAGAWAASYVGLTGKPAVRIESACASGSAALWQAVNMVRSRLYDVVLVVGVEKMRHRETSEVALYLGEAGDFSLEIWNGLTFPGLFALMATAYMHRYGAREEHLAMVAVKNHKHASMNPKAQYPYEIRLEDVMSSRVVAWPLKLYDCSPITDGASAVIVASSDVAGTYTDEPVHVIGSGHATDTLGVYERDDIAFLGGAKRAADQAYKTSKTTPGDVDLAEVHDCFTIAEIMLYEALGFAERGKGYKLLEEGATYYDSNIPVNVSGGLKAKGHPVGATGLGQVYEVWLQLTGRAGKRQVSNAEIALTHNMGGSGATNNVFVFRRV
jgi:acetyl-CoA acetyltransferase